MTPEERVDAMPLHWLPPPYQGMPHMAKQRDEIVRLIRAAVAEEREACARIAETLPFRDSQMDDCRSADIAAAIRARSQPPAPAG